MSNEARVSVSLTIKQGSKSRQSQPTSFNADVTGTNGPTPGSILVGVTHTEPDLTQITSPGGFCVIQNIDATNFVEVGVYSSHFTEFFPMMELLPGEIYVVRLSRYLGVDLKPGTGSGAQDAFTNKLSLKAVGAACRVILECFDK